MGISMEHKETEQVGIACRMSVLLWHTYVLIKLKKVTLWWQKSCTEWEIKLTSRLHCRVMCGEPECSIGMWNVIEYQLMTNSAVVGWNSKLTAV